MTAIANWDELDGEAVLAGFDPLKLPPDRFFSWVWHMFVRNKDEKGRAQLEMDVHRPLPGQDPGTVTSGPWSDEAMAESFMAFATQAGGSKALKSAIKSDVERDDSSSGVDGRAG